METNILEDLIHQIFADEDRDVSALKTEFYKLIENPEAFKPDFDIDGISEGLDEETYINRTCAYTILKAMVELLTEQENAAE